MIPYSKPSYTELEAKYVTESLNGDNYGYVKKFEKMFGDYLGIKYCLATSSCTGALHIGLRALGISEGDRIAMGDINWIATVAPVMYLGAVPDFIDIEPESCCINALNISNTPKAIIATHLYGNLCDMEVVEIVAEHYGIPVIEDAAEALGSIYKGSYAGTMGKFGVFSFHATKTISTGEGGMFVTDDADLYNKALTIADHGRNPKEKRMFYPWEIGLKYRMSNAQAAIGCAQLERIDDFLAKKREIMLRYMELLEPISGLITMNPEPNNCTNSYWMPTVILNNGMNKEYVLKKVKDKGIDARPVFYPLSSLPMFEKKRNPVAYSVSSRAINLPSFYDITENELSYVTKTLIEIVGAV